MCVNVAERGMAPQPPREQWMPGPGGPGIRCLRSRSGLARDAVLGADHPRQLLEALEDRVQDVGARGIFVVDSDANGLIGPSGVLDRFGDV
jgi:hypothetical protein